MKNLINPINSKRNAYKDNFRHSASVLASKQQMVLSLIPWCVELSEELNSFLSI